MFKERAFENLVFNIISIAYGQSCRIFSLLNPSLYRVLRQSTGAAKVIERNLIEMLVIKKCYYPVKVP